MDNINYSDFNLMWKVADTNNLVMYTSAYRWIEYFKDLIERDAYKHVRFDWVGPWHRGLDEDTEKRWHGENSPQYRRKLVEGLATYSDCTDTAIKPVSKNNKQYFNIKTTVYDGDSMYGQRTTVRCYVEIDLPTINPAISELMKAAILDKAESTLIRREKEVRLRQINQIMQDMCKLEN